MSERIEPALNAREWDDFLHHRPFTMLSTVDLIAHGDASEKHPAAAVCLYGQPFGFTYRDVEMLRDYAKWNPQGVDERDNDIPDEEWMSLADRIAALLPPDKPSEETP